MYEPYKLTRFPDISLSFRFGIFNEKLDFLITGDPEFYQMATRQKWRKGTQFSLCPENIFYIEIITKKSGN